MQLPRGPRCLGLRFTNWRRDIPGASFVLFVCGLLVVVVVGVKLGETDGSWHDEGMPPAASASTRAEGDFAAAVRAPSAAMDENESRHASHAEASTTRERAAGSGKTDAAISGSGAARGGQVSGVTRPAPESSSDPLARIRKPSPSAIHDSSAARTIAPPSIAIAASSTRVFELAPGVQAPAALAESDPTASLTPLHEALKETIANRFADEIEGKLADPTISPEALGETWAAAQARADARFRAMFGDAAYLQHKAALARKALAR
jgi:hypothetical protein